jgi:hypothetical protein
MGCIRTKLALHVDGKVVTRIPGYSGIIWRILETSIPEYSGMEYFPASDQKAQPHYRAAEAGPPCPSLQP